MWTECCRLGSSCKNDVSMEPMHEPALDCVINMTINYVLPSENLNRYSCLLFWLSVWEFDFTLFILCTVHTMLFFNVGIVRSELLCRWVKRFSYWRTLSGISLRNHTFLYTGDFWLMVFGQMSHMRMYLRYCCQIALTLAFFWHNWMVTTLFKALITANLQFDQIKLQLCKRKLHRFQIWRLKAGIFPLN